MSTNHASPKLRFRAGKFEQQVLHVILALQFTLGTMLVFMVLAWAAIVSNTYLSASRNLGFYPEMLPLVVGMAAAVYFLNQLYE